MRILRLCGGRFWDTLYLTLLGWTIMLLPACMEDDLALGCAAGGRRRRNCEVLVPPLTLMTLATLAPVAGAFVLRSFAFGFLKSKRRERRRWSFFFVLALKAFAQPVVVPDEFVALCLAGVFLIFSGAAGRRGRGSLAPAFGPLVRSDGTTGDERA